MSQIAFDFLTLLVYLIAEILPVSAPLLSSASCPTSITYTLPDGGKSHTYDSLNRIATRTSVIGTITRTYQGTSSRILSVIPSSGPKTLMTYGTVAEASASRRSPTRPLPVPSSSSTATPSPKIPESPFALLRS